MSQNHPNDNIYSILDKLEALKPTPQERHDATVQQIRESVEARGSITSGVSSVEKRLTERFAAESDFSKMSNAIQKTGKSKASADAITAAAGREKLGQKEMTRRAVAGKKKAAHEGNVVSGALADKSIPVGATIPGTNLKKNKQIEVEEAFNPNSVDAQQARDSKAHHHAELKKKADAGDADAQKRLDMIKKRRDADVKNFNDKMDYMEECAMCAEGTCTEHGVAEGFPTVADAKADHEKNKTTGKFDSKKNRDTGGTIYTRKSSTYDDGGKDKDMKKADKKSVKESMSAVQSRFLMEANLKRMAEEHGQTLDEMMAKMSEDMKHYRDTGECSAFLRDCMDMHGHNKKLEMEEAMNRPELPDPWMGVKDTPHPAKPSFASRVAGTAKSFGQKALSTLGHPSDEEMLKDLERKAMDEELDQLAELAGLKVTKRAMPEATVKVDTPDEEPVNAPKERYATMKQAPNVLGVGDGDIAGGDHPNHGGPGDNPLAPDLRKPRSVHPVKTLEAYINAEYESIKKAK